MSRRWLYLAVVILGCSSTSPKDMEVLESGPAVSAVTDSLLFGVRDVAVAPGGDIWVVSRHEPFLRRYSAGRPVASFGRQGSGPGEFLSPWSFIRGDQQVPPRVFDPGARLIVQLDSAGREQSRTPFRTTWGFVRSDIEDVSYGQVFRAHSYSRDALVSLVYLGDVGTTRDLRHSALVRFTPLGHSIDTLVVFETDDSAARWLVAVPLVAGCPDGTTAVYDGLAPEIRGYGGAEAGWRIPLPGRLTIRRGMPAADLERYVRYRVLGELLENQVDTGQLERRVAEQLRTGKASYAVTVPPLVGLLCDEGHRVWLQQFDTRDDPIGKGRDWAVLGPDSMFALVRFPPGFLPLAFDRTTILGVLRDSLGVETIARVALPGALTSTPGGP